MSRFNGAFLCFMLSLLSVSCYGLSVVAPSGYFSKKLLADFTQLTGINVAIRGYDEDAVIITYLGMNPKGPSSDIFILPQRILDQVYLSKIQEECFMSLSCSHRRGMNAALGNLVQDKKSGLYRIPFAVDGLHVFRRVGTKRLGSFQEFFSPENLKSMSPRSVCVLGSVKLLVHAAIISVYREMGYVSVAKLLETLRRVAPYISNSLLDVKIALDLLRNGCVDYVITEEDIEDNSAIVCDVLEAYFSFMTISIGNKTQQKEEAERFVQFILQEHHIPDLKESDVVIEQVDEDVWEKGFLYIMEYLGCR